jgi:hypothetical protein
MSYKQGYSPVGIENPGEECRERAGYKATENVPKEKRQTSLHNLQTPVGDGWELCVMIDGWACKRSQTSVGVYEGCRAIETPTVVQHFPENDKTHCQSEEE